MVHVSGYYHKGKYMVRIYKERFRIWVSCIKLTGRGCLIKCVLCRFCLVMTERFNKKVVNITEFGECIVTLGPHKNRIKLILRNKLVSSLPLKHCIGDTIMDW